ncbi:riboflavin synthase [Marinicella gelatinilytica]|uniref:riboflavin synthase n=1 Tax=Marinicella gelatinilytica TaxID=2996017 RepID=UPI0022608202|nr:riboflavin synthase [Marinicella gelatinilytica]MCX7543888.1 riboflavin synthase [Marinicella gelatinilytica]
MFTGIIQSIGEVIEHNSQDQGDLRFHINTALADYERIQIGDSIAMDGVCLTVVDRRDDVVAVDVSMETVRKTSVKAWQPGTAVNIEPALTLQTPLGGHLVSGHVDGLATCVKRESEARSEVFTFQLPPGFERFVVPKGSITLNGVSLTVNEVNGDQFTVNLIPHTLEATNLDSIQVNHQVNFEIDTMARYADKMLQYYNR